MSEKVKTLLIKFLKGFAIGFISVIIAFFLTVSVFTILDRLAGFNYNHSIQSVVTNALQFYYSKP